LGAGESLQSKSAFYPANRNCKIGQRPIPLLLFPLPLPGWYGQRLAKRKARRSKQIKSDTHPKKNQFVAWQPPNRHQYPARAQRRSLHISVAVTC